MNQRSAAHGLLGLATLGATLLAAVAVSVSGAGAQPAASPSPTSSSTAASAAPAAPPGEAVAAQSAANEAGRRVALLAADVHAAELGLATATNSAQAVQARYALAVAAQRRATAAARVARAADATAALTYQRDHRAFVDVVTASYLRGGTVADFASLLASADPGALLSQADMSQSVSQFRAEVVASDAASAAFAAQARTRLDSSLTAAAAAAARIKTLSDAARTTQTAATAALRRLQGQLAAARTSQAAADAVLSHFLGGWAVADPARADALDSQYLALARSNSAHALAPSGSGWTAAQGQSVVWRALMWIGTPYAWAGGNGSGPTTGICTRGAAQNDCHVTGFDCSGLALYGWAPYLSMAHLASTQYLSGRVHPNPDALLPGDLVFWSTNGTVAGIHHVAIYVGDGNVLQAPQSGDIVRVTPLASVDSGYFGATRPRS